MAMNIFIRQKYGRYFEKLYVMNIWKPIPLKLDRDIGQ